MAVENLRQFTTRSLTSELTPRLVCYSHMMHRIWPTFSYRFPLVWHLLHWEIGFQIADEVLSYGTFYKYSLIVYYDLISLPCINLMSFLCTVFIKSFVFYCHGSFFTLSNVILICSMSTLMDHWNTEWMNEWMNEHGFLYGTYRFVWEKQSCVYTV